MKSVEAVGKSINQAIENGLKILNVSEDDVSITVLSTGGLFSKYKVKLTVIEKQIKVEQKELTQNVEAPEKEEFKLEPKSKISTPGINIEKVNYISNEKFITDKSTSIVLQNFYDGLFSALKIEGKILIEADEEKIHIAIRTNDAGILIGHRGKTLNEIQYLTYLIVGKKTTDTRRISVDVEHYREKRDMVIEGLANRMAKKVVSTHHSIKLDPMNAYERRIIHSALEDDRFVATHSEGTEPNRYLVIEPKENR